MLPDYYSTKTVNKGRKDYICECCGGKIPKNTPSDIHSFYPFDSGGIRTHEKCSELFLNGWFCEYCGEWIPDGQQCKYKNKTICQDCYDDEVKDKKI